MPKFFRNPFAFSGDKVAIPDDTQPSGEVSYADGFGPDYQAEQGVDPNAKDIERTTFNQFAFDTTENLKQWQTFGLYEYITPVQNNGAPFPYAKEALCVYGGLIYQSLVDNNTANPTDLSKWGRPANFAKLFVDSGGANNYVLNSAQGFRAPDAYYPGMEVVFFATSDNTGASTLNLFGLGSKDIVREYGTDKALIGGEISGYTTLIYDGTRFAITRDRLEEISTTRIIDHLVGVGTLTAGSAFPNSAGVYRGTFNFEPSTQLGGNTDNRYINNKDPDGFYWGYERKDQGGIQNFLYKIDYNPVTKLPSNVYEYSIDADWPNTNAPQNMFIDGTELWFFYGLGANNWSSVRWTWNAGSQNWDFGGSSGAISHPNSRIGVTAAGIFKGTDGSYWIASRETTGNGRVFIDEITLNSGSNSFAFAGTSIQIGGNYPTNVLASIVYTSTGVLQSTVSDVGNNTNWSNTYTWNPDTNTFDEVAADISYTNLYDGFFLGAVWDDVIFGQPRTTAAPRPDTLYEYLSAGATIDLEEVGKLVTAGDTIEIPDTSQYLVTGITSDNSITVSGALPAGTQYGKFQRVMADGDACIYNKGVGVWRAT